MHVLLPVEWLIDRFVWSSEAGGRRIYVGPGRRGSVLVTQCMSSNALSVLG